MKNYPKLQQEQITKMRDLIFSTPRQSDELIAKAVGCATQTVWYYKKKYGLTKKYTKRKAKASAATPRSKKLSKDMGEVLSLVALKNSYDNASILEKAMFLQGVKSWVEEEIVKMNALK